MRSCICKIFELKVNAMGDDSSKSRSTHRDVSKVANVTAVKNDDQVDPMIQSLLGQLQALQGQETSLQRTTFQSPPPSSLLGQPSTSRQTSNAATPLKMTRQRRKSCKRSSTDDQPRPSIPVLDLPGALTLEMVESAQYGIPTSTSVE